MTDTIMLDDFKTELKRLGMKRIQKEEMRRQSFALVLDDKDEDEEVESAEALNPGSRMANGNRLSPSNSPDGRLRHADSTSNSSAEKRGAPKPQTGKGGTRISQLPGLKSLNFGKKKEKADVGVRDLEKQESPTPQDSHDDVSPPDTRVDDMRGSLGGLDFHTKPAGF